MFDEGIQTKRKLTPAMVRKRIIEENDNHGKTVFGPDDLLTTTQIASRFSALVQKREKTKTNGAGRWRRNEAMEVENGDNDYNEEDLFEDALAYEESALEDHLIEMIESLYTD